MLRSSEWLVIVLIGSDFQKVKQMRHNVPYRIVDFRNLNPCSLADRYQHFRVTCCLHFLSWTWWQQVLPLSLPSHNMLTLSYQTVRPHLPEGCELNFVQHKWYTIKPPFLQLGIDMLQNTDLQIFLNCYWTINNQLSEMVSNLWSVFMYCYQTPNIGTLWSWTLALRLNAFICTCLRSYIYVVITFFRINKNSFALSYNLKKS